jgi:hypothetical protein
METAAASTATGDGMQATCDKLAELRQRARRHAARRPQSSAWNTEWLLGRSSSASARRRAGHGALGHQRKESRGAHQRLDGYERATTSTSSSTRWPPTGATDRRASLRPVKITKSPPGPRLRRRRRAGRGRTQGTTTRGRPCLKRPRCRRQQDHRDRGAALPAPTGQQARLADLHGARSRDDMSVLQGLQYIKDDLDGTPDLPLVVPHGHLRQLRHDDQRQAEAVLQTFLRDYAQEGARRGAGALPDRARPGGRPERTSSTSSKRSSPTSSRPSRAALAGRIPADAGSRSRYYEQFSSASTACCATPPARSTGWTRVHRPGRAGPAAPLQRRLARRRQAERMDWWRLLLRGGRDPGCTRSATAPRSAPRRMWREDPAIMRGGVIAAVVTNLLLLAIVWGTRS